MNIKSFSRSSGQNLFYFTGQPDQRFYLQDSGSLGSSTASGTWTNSPKLEFYDSSGTLLYLDDTDTNTLLEFFRTMTAQ